CRRCGKGDMRRQPDWIFNLSGLFGFAVAIFLAWALWPAAPYPPFVDNELLQKRGFVVFIGGLFGIASASVSQAFLLGLHAVWSAAREANSAQTAVYTMIISAISLLVAIAGVLLSRF